MPHSQSKASAAKAPGSSNPIRHAVFLVSDQVEYLKDAHQAFEALEMLITPVMAQDSERLELERSQLGCLLRVMNRNMREQIATTQELVSAAREAA